MEELYIDCTNFKNEGMHVVIKRGTHYDKLQYDDLCRVYDLDGIAYGIGKIHECVVVRFEDIKPTMVLNRDIDHLWKDMMEEYLTFHKQEIVTLIYLTIHNRYEDRG